jgi:hypothetical protein
MMVLDKKPHIIKFCESSEAEITNIWEIKADGSIILWSRKDKKLEEKNESRNEKIAQIRDHFLSPIKSRKHNYEIHCDYFYKSKEHQEQFYEILEAAGLVKSEPELEIQREPYDIDGFCHYNVSIPKRRIEAKHYPTKLELSIIENRNMSELGGLDINKEIDFSNDL